MNRRNLNKMIQIMCSIFSICIIIAPENLMKVLLHLLAGIIVSVFMFWKYDKLAWNQ